MGIFMGFISILYCAVFFLKGTRRRLAALFITDSLILAGLFITAAPASVIAVFIVSAACANLTLFFIPEAPGLTLDRADCAALLVNALCAGLAAFYLVRNRLQPGISAAALNPVIAAFLFMALSTAGYYAASAAGGEKK
jgi:hypothetical protein